MPKFLQCHRQPRAPRKRSVPSVNDHPAIVDIFRKFYENGPCIQTISFRVTMFSSNSAIKLRQNKGIFSTLLLTTYNCHIILRKQNPLYISKTKFMNRQGGHVLIVFALKLFTFKKCTYANIYIYIHIYIYIYISVVIYLYFLLFLSILVLLFIFS